jgi:hypothetical protein
MRDSDEHGLIFHYAYPGEVGFIVDDGGEVVEFPDGLEYFKRWGKSRSSQLVAPWDIEPVEEPTPLTLIEAEFHDENGNHVVVKRSPCRHYYLKVSGQKQKRVSLADIKRVVGGL